MKIKRIYAVSPLSLLALSACGGGSSSEGDSAQNALINLSGNVLNGPLKNALVFIDRDGDGVQGNLEPNLRTNSKRSSIEQKPFSSTARSPFMYAARMPTHAIERDLVARSSLHSPLRATPVPGGG